jgi:Ran GTPase-activating protein (RanGAP) involved in mRNA processing and transport
MVPILSNLALYCPDLETLDIRDNFLCGSAVDLMAEVIVQCKKLKNLNFSDCNIEEEANEVIIEALSVIISLLIVRKAKF